MALSTLLLAFLPYFRLDLRFADFFRPVLREDDFFRDDDLRRAFFLAMMTPFRLCVRHFLILYVFVYRDSRQRQSSKT